jgi:hypothetical protein
MKRIACTLFATAVLTLSVPASMAQTAAPAKKPVADASAKKQWKKATWHSAQQKNRQAGGGSVIIPTDCPPLPHEECLKTWE